MSVCVLCVCECKGEREKERERLCAVFRPPEKLYPIYLEDNPVENFTSLLLFLVSVIVKYRVSKNHKSKVTVFHLNDNFQPLISLIFRITSLIVLICISFYPIFYSLN